MVRFVAQQPEMFHISFQVLEIANCLSSEPQAAFQHFVMAIASVVQQFSNSPCLLLSLTGAAE
jgi:hypothetical protein